MHGGLCTLAQPAGPLPVSACQLYAGFMVQSYNIIQLFLIANLLTTTSTLPVLAGLIRHRHAYRIVTSFTMLVGCAFGLSSVFWWCAIANNRCFDWLKHPVSAISSQYRPSCCIVCLKHY